MRVALLVLTMLCASLPVLSQRPSIPPQAIEGPDLGYRPIAVAAAFDLPAGAGFESVAAVDIDSRRHLYVLHRADQALMEFDADGQFIRAFGEGLFARSHGLRIDAEDNLWVTDVSDHVVMKLNPEGEVLLTLGTRGEAGEWDEAAGSRLFNQPNDVAIGPNGNIFVPRATAVGRSLVFCDLMRTETSSPPGAGGAPCHGSSKSPTPLSSIPTASCTWRTARIEGFRFSTSMGTS